MGRIQNKQAGFNIVELLVIIVAVGVIGVGGWFVYQHNRTQLSGATSSGQPNRQTTTTTTPTAARLDIKEWGVHMTLSSTTASMYYRIDPSNPDKADLSLKAISDIDPLCGTNQSTLGVIYRQTTSPNMKTSPNTAIQIGNYWYRYSLARAACINNTQEVGVQKAVPGYSDNAMIDTFNTLAVD